LCVFEKGPIKKQLDIHLVFFCGGKMSVPLGKILAELGYLLGDYEPLN
jgi:hypothetical protein